MDEKERIEKLMETEGMNANQFAVEIGIQSSTLSHILNGRNKPSLDVLKRILNRFSLVSPDWLILGIGAMYRATAQSQQATLFDFVDETSSVTTSNDEKIAQKESVSEISSVKPISETPVQTPIVPIQTPVAANVAAPIVEKAIKADKKVSKVLIFYSDNTFEELYPQ